jgi:hypothetical protein
MCPFTEVTIEGSQMLLGLTQKRHALNSPYRGHVAESPGPMTPALWEMHSTLTAWSSEAGGGRKCLLFTVIQCGVFCSQQKVTIIISLGIYKVRVPD